MDHLLKKRVMVDKSCLLDLFLICNHPGCGCPRDRDDIKMYTVGAALVVSGTCTNSHDFHWSSSSTVGKGKKKMFEINIVTASYVLLCGLNIERVRTLLLFEREEFPTIVEFYSFWNIVSLFFHCSLSQRSQPNHNLNLTQYQLELE